MPKRAFDAIIIGGGSAGLSFAKTAAGCGAKVALVERDALGGTCVNRGCVPKKLMWTLAHTAKDASALEGRGVMSERPAIDFAAFRRTSDDHIASINASMAETLEEKGVTVLRGEARLADGSAVTVDGERYEADHIVIAIGGAPSRPDIEGEELGETSDDVLAWKSLPASMVIVGGGYIGCEFAAIFSALGVSVTLISDGDAVLTEFSRPMRDLAKANLEAAGVRVILNARPQRAETGEEGLRLSLDSDETLTAQRVVWAIGRAPNAAALGDMADRIEREESGAIAIDDGFATNIEGLYALGDCTPRLPLTPVARDDGRVLALRLFGDASAQAVPSEHVATTAFLLPPLAEVGQRDDHDLHATLDPLEEGVLACGARHGWALSFDEDGAVIGAALAADGAANAAAPLAQLVALGAPRASFERLLPIHPSTAEEIRPGVIEG
ncbi:MAG: FAD-dependent oxidoreductase [Pseudomonadota bacterium]